MRGKTLEILKEATRKGYAVGAFNTSITEITQGIARAINETRKQCIIQVTPSSIKYVGPEVLGAVVKTVIDNESGDTEIGFHLDHGKTFDDVVTAIDFGVDSVMIDASTKEFKRNVAITKRVVEYAHSKGVTVQAELGKVPYVGRNGQDVDWESVMTNPREAKQLVEETGVDALAVGIGNAHGFFREREIPDWKRLEEIKEMIPSTPLIMHGASDWNKDKVKNAVARGVVCFNVDTDIRLAFINAVCNQTSPKCDFTDPRKALTIAREAVKNKVVEKIEMFYNATY
jgi:fructose-bisphosphate aldolase class II